MLAITLCLPLDIPLDFAVSTCCSIKSKVPMNMFPVWNARLAPRQHSIVGICPQVYFFHLAYSQLLKFKLSTSPNGYLFANHESLFFGVSMVFNPMISPWHRHHWPPLPWPRTPALRPSPVAPSLASSWASSVASFVAWSSAAFLAFKALALAALSAGRDAPIALLMGR